jgi:ubiquinone/menaquinone biosynthesis C-methylase UbiE
MSLPEPLLKQQYRTDANLQARIALHQRFSTNSYPWQRWVFDHLHLPEQARVLELGCGPARLWLENQDRIPSGWEIVLSDFSAGMLAAARAKLRHLPHTIRYHQINAQAIPFAAASFDAVIANHMLYHVPDRPQALSGIRRVLKEGGWLLAATNGQRHMQELIELRQRLLPNVKRYPLQFNRVAFTLENGAAQLAPYFVDITLDHYEDDLIVTESAPLVAYIQSMLSGYSLPPTFADALADIIEKEIQREGAFYIHKATGLFVARRA